MLEIQKSDNTAEFEGAEVALRVGRNRFEKIRGGNVPSGRSHRAHEARHGEDRSAKQA